MILEVKYLANLITKYINSLITVIYTFSNNCYPKKIILGNSHLQSCFCGNAMPSKDTITGGSGKELASAVGVRTDVTTWRGWTKKGQKPPQ